MEYSLELLRLLAVCFLLKIRSVSLWACNRCCLFKYCLLLLNVVHHFSYFACISAGHSHIYTQKKKQRCSQYYEYYFVKKYFFFSSAFFRHSSFVFVALNSFFQPTFTFELFDGEKKTCEKWVLFLRRTKKKTQFFFYFRLTGTTTQNKLFIYAKRICCDYWLHHKPYSPFIFDRFRQEYVFVFAAHCKTWKCFSLFPSF